MGARLSNTECVGGEVVDDFTRGGQGRPHGERPIGGAFAGRSPAAPRVITGVPVRIAAKARPREVSPEGATQAAGSATRRVAGTRRVTDSRPNRFTRGSVAAEVELYTWQPLRLCVEKPVLCRRSTPFPQHLTSPHPQCGVWERRENQRPGSSSTTRLTTSI